MNAYSEKKLLARHVDMSLPVIVSYSNYGYKDFSLNLIKNVKDVIKNHLFVFYCIDDEIYKYLLPYQSDKIQIKYFDVGYKNTGYHSYNKGDFNKITKLKLDVIKHCLQEYNYIHYVDGDVVFFKEPTIEYYAPYSTYDIIYQCDTTKSADISKWNYEWANPCLGNFVLRNTPGTIKHLDKIVAVLASKNVNDQEAQVIVFQNEGVKDIRKYTDAKLCEFPAREFVCGEAIKRNLVKIQDIMVFHANWVVGHQAKVALLKKVGKWYT
jgi:hypothetical protein